jgi:hypothetical protein
MKGWTKYIVILSFFVENKVYECWVFWGGYIFKNWVR